MNYLETIAYLDSLSPTLEKPSLARLTLFMSEHGDLQNKIPCFHVGGTNGKGSTVAILESILRNSGLKTARFTGPHLLRWNERFYIAGRPISDDDFARVASYMRVLSEEFSKRHPEFGPLTWFEFLTALAFQKFIEEGVDVAVYEVGLGGRFDATNVVANVLASVITNVSLDHTHLLGGTVEEIAFEKAGIIKSGIPLITAATGAARTVIARRAGEVGAPLTVCALDEDERVSAVLSRLPLTAEPISSHIVLSRLPRTAELISRNLALKGEHQKLNALVALTALARSGLMSGADNSINLTLQNDLFDLSDGLRNVICAGLRSVRWAGRMQLLSENLILDGAHNPAGAEALRASLDSGFPQFKRIFIISCFENKNAREMLSLMLRSDDLVFVQEASGRRQSHSAQYLAEIVRSLGADARVSASIEAALKAALEEKKPDQLLVVSGSFAAIRETLTFFGFKDVEDSLALSQFSAGGAAVGKGTAKR